MRVGSTDPADRNILSGNDFSSSGGQAGINISHGSVGLDDVKVENNYVGTDITGTLPLGNGIVGIDIGPGVSNLVIGGPTSASRNIVADNGDPSTYN